MSSLPRSLRGFHILLLTLLLTHLFAEAASTSQVEWRGLEEFAFLQPELPLVDWDGHAWSSQSLAGCSLCHFSVTLPTLLLALSIFLIGPRQLPLRHLPPPFALSPPLPPPR